MPPSFHPEDLRAYRDRNWKAAREAKEQFWAEDHRRRGPQAGLASSSAMWEHARALDPSWPDERQRADDLAHHMELAERIRRVAHVFTRR